MLDRNDITSRVTMVFTTPFNCFIMFVCLFVFFRRETVSELLDHMLHDVQLHPDVALVNGISVLLTLLEVRKGRQSKLHVTKHFISNATTWDTGTVNTTHYYSSYVYYQNFIISKNVHEEINLGMTSIVLSMVYSAVLL